LRNVGEFFFIFKLSLLRSDFAVPRAMKTKHTSEGPLCLEFVTTVRRSAGSIGDC